MIYQLTKFKRDAWSGHTRFAKTNINLGPETGLDGEPVTGLTQTEARELEKLMFKPAGHYDSGNIDFWRDFKIPYPETGLKLNDELPLHRLQLAVLRSMKKVANGRADLKKKSKAEYLLTSVEQTEKEDDEKLSSTERAYDLLINATPKKLRQIYTVLMKEKKNGVVIDASSVSDKAVKNGLRTAIAANPNSFVAIAEDEKLNLKAEIIELVSSRILSTSNGGYSEGNTPLAADLDGMVAYMENPHNQDKVIKWKQESKVKNKK